jgi:hypothetical protein
MLFTIRVNVIVGNLFPFKLCIYSLSISSRKYIVVEQVFLFRLIYFPNLRNIATLVHEFFNSLTQVNQIIIGITFRVT